MGGLCCQHSKEGIVLYRMAMGHTQYVKVVEMKNTSAELYAFLISNMVLGYFKIHFPLKRAHGHLLL